MAADRFDAVAESEPDDATPLVLPACRQKAELRGEPIPPPPPPPGPDPVFTADTASLKADGALEFH